MNIEICPYLYCALKLGILILICRLPFMIFAWYRNKTFSPTSAISVCFALGRPLPRTAFVSIVIALLAGVAYGVLPSNVPPIAIACGAALATVILSVIWRGQGIPVPLGCKLTMTLESTKGQETPRSISFHVEENCIKDKKKILRLLISTMACLNTMQCTHDVVLKSWFLAARNDQEARAFRRAMRGIQLTTYLFVLLAMALGYMVCVDLAHDFALGLSPWVLLFAKWGFPTLAFVFAVLLVFARKETARIATYQANAQPPRLYLELEQGILKHFTHLKSERIAVEPIPAVHIFSLAVTKPSAIKGCTGAQAGFTLKPR